PSRYFLSGVAVGEGACRMLFTCDHGLPVARGLGDPHRTRDRCAERLPREMRADVLGHLSAEIGARIVHRQQNGCDRQFGIEVLLDELDVLQQLTQTLERIVFALDRYEDLTCSDEGVEGEQAEARRAVDDDVVDSISGLLLFPEVDAQCPLQTLFARD